jgi:hypothetical protein
MAPSPGKFRKSCLQVTSIPLSLRLRPALEDCNTRLLLDPWLSVGPGCEVHADTLFALTQRCASLGLTLCVEEQAWLEAARDPDVVRRKVDLLRFEPLVKLPPLPLPSEREALTRFVPARSEIDQADLKLLGALHARVADLLVALDGRLHRLATRAGLGGRVLTPADALAWLDSLAGAGTQIIVREVDPRSVLAPGPLSDLVEQECEPSDPYLRSRLQLANGRVLAVFEGEVPRGIGVVASAGPPDRLELIALAGDERCRGSRLLEPIVAAALSFARRRGQALEALLPPHEETTLLLLEQLGFARLGPDGHGRERLRHPPSEKLWPLEDDGGAWLLPLSAAEHEQLLPELGPCVQEPLFGRPANATPGTLGSPLRKQLLLAGGGRTPWPGDRLLVYHGRAAGHPAANSITALARVEAVTHCAELDEILALSAARPGYRLSDIRSRLAAGPVVVADLRLQGRLSRLLPLALLKDAGVVKSAPRALMPLTAEAWLRLTERLELA